MKSRSVAIVAALTAVTASGCGVGVHFVDYRHTATMADAHVTGAVTELQVDAGDGHVVVNTGSGDGVTVHRVVHYQSGHPHPGQQLSGGALTFSAGCSRCRVDYDLTVPASVRVRARTDNGRITVAGVASADVGSDSGSVTVRHVANGVKATSDSGSVHIDDSGGALTAHTDSGSIHATAVRAATATAGSDSGSISLAFVSVPTSVRATNDSGSVRLALPVTGTPPVHYNVTVDTGSGGRHISVPTSSTATAKINVNTDSGSANIAPAA